MTPPRTEAGKRLLELVDGLDRLAGVATSKSLTLGDATRLAIANIEAEAVAAERARIAEGVRKHIAHHGHEPGKNCVSAFCAAGLHRAVLALIEEKP
jgi:hypothetical protein